MTQHPQQVLSRDQIEQALWEWGSEPESNAPWFVGYGNGYKPWDWLETVYGIGYRLNPDVLS